MGDAIAGLAIRDLAKATSYAVILTKTIRSAELLLTTNLTRIILVSSGLSLDLCMYSQVWTMTDCWGSRDV